MKKYLLALIPALIGISLSLAFTMIAPTDYLTNPYRNKQTLSLLASSWFIIGLGLSVTAIVLIFLESVFDWTGKYMDRRSMEKSQKRREQKKGQHNQAL